MRLFDDEPRCHDDRCEPREYCERWRQRHQGGRSTVRTATRRMGWEPHTRLCMCSIPVKNTPDALMVEVDG
jgi:hypothetical protein